MNLRVFIFLIFIISTNYMNSQCKELIPLQSISNNYMDSTKSDLIIPDYNMRIDDNGNLFLNENVIIERKNDFKFCIYELFKGRFIIVSILNEKNYKSNYSYLLPKSEVVVIDLMEPDNLYKQNIANKFIHDIYYNEDGALIIQGIDKVHNFELNKL